MVSLSSEFIATLVLSVLLLGVLVWDFRTLRIPNVLNFALAAAGLAVSTLILQRGVVLTIVSGLIVYGVFWGIAEVYFRMRQRAGLGGGDVKFLAAASAWVGLSGVPWLLLTASFSGILFMLVGSVCGKAMDQHTRLAFGPHLALGTMVVWLSRDLLVS